MLEYITICLNELNETNECWIEKNSFGGSYVEVYSIVQDILIKLNYQFEITDLGYEKGYYITLVL